MPDIWMDVDAALSEVPVNIAPLIDDTDFKTRETSIAYNATGMDLVWNFVTTAGAYTQTAVTPTTSGNYDWAHQGDGMYSIEIPASGGASINNDTEGFGWFTGVCTGVLPWRGPMIGFRAAALNNALIDGGDYLEVDQKQYLGSDCPAADTAGYQKVTVRSGTGTGEINLSSGVVKADVDKWKGQTAATVDTNGYPVVTIKDGTGQGELLTTSGKIDGTMQTGNVTVGDYVSGKSPAELLLSTPANKLTTDASGKVLLQGTTHTGAVIPTVTDVTNGISFSQANANLVWRAVGLRNPRAVSGKTSWLLSDYGGPSTTITWNGVSFVTTITTKDVEDLEVWNDAYYSTSGTDSGVWVSGGKGNLPGNSFRTLAYTIANTPEPVRAINLDEFTPRNLLSVSLPTTLHKSIALKSGHAQGMSTMGLFDDETAQTWTETSPGSKIYWRTRTGADTDIVFVCDGSVRTNLAPTSYLKKSSLGEVVAGSWFHDGVDKLYVRTLDDRSPQDPDIFVCLKLNYNVNINVAGHTYTVTSIVKTSGNEYSATIIPAFQGEAIADTMAITGTTNYNHTYSIKAIAGNKLSFTFDQTGGYPNETGLSATAESTMVKPDNTVYIEGLTFLFGKGTDSPNLMISTPVASAAENTVVAGVYGSAIAGGKGIGLSYQRIRTAYSELVAVTDCSNDLLNYHTAGIDVGGVYARSINLMYEIDCYLKGSGATTYGTTPTTVGINQPSTMHEGQIGVRIRGYYENADGSSIADERGCISLCFGCNAGPSLRTDSNSKSAFWFGETNVNGWHGLALLVGCIPDYSDGGYAISTAAGSPQDDIRVDMWGGGYDDPIYTNVNLKDVYGINLDKITTPVRTGDYSTGQAPDELVGASVVDGAVTYTQALTALLAFVAGESDGAGAGPSTINFRRQNGTTAAMTMTVDQHGNRSMVVKDLG